MTHSAIHTSDANFERDVISAELPVLVDFWAPWCGPCRHVAPVLEELANEYSGKVRIAKLNTDENPQISAALGIRSIPTLVIFKDGKPVDGVVGAVPKDTLKKLLEKHLSPAAILEKGA